MKKTILIAFLLIGIFSGIKQSYGDTIPDDFMLWTELKIKYQIKPSKFVFVWGTESRFDDGASEYMLFNTTVGFYYKVAKWFQTGLYYRLEKELGKNTENRVFPQGTFKVKAGPVKFAFRNRFEIRMFTSGETRFRYRLRIKFGPKFKVATITLNPFVFNEFFFETKKSNDGFNQDRLGTGLTIGFLKGLVKYTPYFMVRFDQKDPWIHRYVFGNKVELTF